MDNIRELKNALTNIQNIETCDDYLKLRANLTNNSQFGLQSPSKLTSFPQLDEISQMRDNNENHPENSQKKKYKKHNDTVFEQGINHNNTTNLQSEFDYPTHKTRILDDEQFDRQQFLNGIDENQFFESSFDGDDSTLQDINKMFNFGRQKQPQQQQRNRQNAYQTNNQRKQTDIYNNYNPNRPQAAQNYVMNQDPSIKRLLNGVDKTIAMATSQKNFGYHSRKYENQKSNYNTAEETTNKNIENSDIKAYLESIEKRFKITTNQQNAPNKQQINENKKQVLPAQQQQQPQQQKQQQQQKHQKNKKSRQKGSDLSIIQDDVFGEEFEGINTYPTQNASKKEPEKKRIFYSKTDQSQSQQQQLSANKQEISTISTTVDTKVMMQNQKDVKSKQKKKNKHKHKKSKCCKKCVTKKHKHKHIEESSSSSDDNSSQSESQSSESRSSSSSDNQSFSSNEKPKPKQKVKKLSMNDSFDDYDDKASQISSANSIYSDLMHSQALSRNNIVYLKQKYGRNSSSIQNRLNYLIQQRRKVQENNDDTEEVFCIDCEEYIKIENVEAHASICQGKKIDNGNALVDDSRTLFNFDNFQGDNNIELELHEYNQKMKKYLTQLKEKLKNFADKSIPTSEFTAICEICCLQIECIEQMILNNCSNQDLTTQISDLAILNKHLLTIQRTRIYNIVKLSARIRNIAKHKQMLLFPDPNNENLQQISQQNGSIKQAQLVVSQFTSPTKNDNQQQVSKQMNQYNQSNVPMNSIHCNQSGDLLLQSPSSIFSSISQKHENCSQFQQKATKNQSNGNLFKKKNNQQQQLSQEKLSQNFIEQFSELNAFSAILNQAVESSGISETFPQTKLQQQCNEQILNERKKQFFSVVMKVKQALPQNHPGKNALINDLFQQAQDKKVPVEKWEEYIISQLKQNK